MKNDPTPMNSDPIAIARASYDAYVRKDRTAIEALIAEDFHFTSPLDNRIDRRTYFDRCWPNSLRISAFDYIRLVADGAVVFVTYEGSNVDGGRFRNTEVLTVRDGQWPCPRRTYSIAEAENGFMEHER
jgi:ketosteroid isomerase-like protein